MMRNREPRAGLVPNPLNKSYSELSELPGSSFPAYIFRGNSKFENYDRGDICHICACAKMSLIISLLPKCLS